MKEVDIYSISFEKLEDTPDTLITNQVDTVRPYVPEIYIEVGALAVSEAVDVDADLPTEQLIINKQYLVHTADEVVRHFSKFFSPRITESSITKFADKIGLSLSEQENDELIAQVTIHPSVRPKIDGSFQILHSESKEVKAIVHKPSVLSRTAVSRAIQKINETPEHKKAVDLAKNRADNRIHKKHHRKSGRGQGKKKTFEQRLVEVQKSPQIKPLTEL